MLRSQSSPLSQKKSFGAFAQSYSLAELPSSSPLSLDESSPRFLSIIIKSSQLGSTPLSFHCVRLDEPDKSTNSAPLPLCRAFVIPRSAGRTVKLCIKIANKLIASQKVRLGSGYPMLATAVQTLAASLPYNYNPFADSVKTAESSSQPCFASRSPWDGTV